MKRSLNCIVAVAVVVLALAWPVSGAFALNADGPLFSVVGDASVRLSCIDIVALPFRSDPETLPVGHACGMENMCGQDPCLCGSADEWGVCACNGVHDEPPRFSLDCDNDGVASLVYVFGRPFLMSLGPGETDAVLTASYDWHGSSSVDVHVIVDDFGPFDALKAVGGALIAALVLLAAALIVARLARSLAERRKCE